MTDSATIKKHEKRGYSRGYQAGMRRREHELRIAQSELLSDRLAREDRFFCAALTGLLQSKSWTVGGEKVNNSTTYIRLAKIFAKEAMEQLQEGPHQ